MLLPAGAASAQAAPTSSPVRADVITEVTPLGWRVVAVAIEYADALDVPADTSAEAAFDVTATFDGEAGSRTVVDAYSSEEAAVDTEGAKGEPGEYLIIELDPDDPNSGALQYVFEEGINYPLPLEGAYSVNQTADVVDADGDVLLADTPFAVMNTGIISPIVDDFASMSFTDSAGTTLNFRLFQPEGYTSDPDSGEAFPLVTFLHGAGERGLNNLTQITANQGAVAFADPERQATDPSFVLAPQVPTPTTNRWTTPEIQAAMLELVDTVTVTYPVDDDRRYLTGLSMGAFGSFDLLPEHPDMFAAALLIAGSGDPEAMSSVTDLPMWITHSIDDPTVDYVTGSLAIVEALEAAGVEVTRGTWPGNLPEDEAEEEALELWQEALANDSHVLFTTFPEGTTPVSAHWSWVPTYSNDVMLDWLFAQERDVAAVEERIEAFRDQVDAFVGEGRLDPRVGAQVQAGAQRVLAWYAAGELDKVAWELRRQTRTLEQNRRVVPDDEVWDYLVDEGRGILEDIVAEGDED